jgi:glycosyltransferase involved in cell wall biosynthesis
MKILHVIPYFNPKRGGDVNVCYNLAKHLAKKGHEVTIYTTDYEYDEEFSKSLKDVKIVSFHCRFNLALFLYTPKIKKTLKREIKNFDIVHLHGFRTYQNAIVSHFAKKHNVSCILQAHGDMPIILEKQKLKKLYDYIWGNKILKYISKAIALTDLEVEQYKEFGVNESKIEIIPNGIDLSIFVNLPKKGKFREKYSIKNDEKLIIFIGRLHKIKGIDLLINAYSSMKKNNDLKAKLAIIGPDEGFLNDIKRQIDRLRLQNDIILTGALYEQEKLEAYVDADVFVLPSTFEMFPITVLESFATNCPVMLSEKCGISNDIIEKKAGVVIKLEPMEMKNDIVTILNNEKLRNQYIINGRKLLHGKYSFESVINKLESLYTNTSNNAK